MKETKLANLYVDVLGLAKNSPDANALLKWKMPGRIKAQSDGEFASMLQIVLQDRTTMKHENKITIGLVNEKLDTLTEAGDRFEQLNVIRFFVTSMTALEQKWIARIILKDMKLNIASMTLLGAFHPDAVLYYNLCSSLKQVCDELQDPDKRTGKRDITLCQPFRVYNEFNGCRCSVAD